MSKKITQLKSRIGPSNRSVRDGCKDTKRALPIFPYLFTFNTAAFAASLSFPYRETLLTSKFSLIGVLETVAYVPQEALQIIGNVLEVAEPMPLVPLGGAFLIGPCHRTSVRSGSL